MGQQRVTGPLNAEPVATPPVGPGPRLPGEARTSRRSMLRHLGVGAATVVVVGIGAGSYRVFDNGVLDAGRGEAYDPWSNWRGDPTPLGAVGAAILAANPHNTQPWIFRVAPDTIELFTDPTRRAGTLDALDREHQIGLGCALENLVLAAAARGFVPTVTLLPDAADPTHVATVRLAAGPRAVSALHDAIGDRHSNRGPYTAGAVPADVLTSLASDVTSIDGVGLRWFTTDGDRATLAALIVDATQAIVDDVEQSKDSFAWLRMSRDELDAHRDGLTLDTQGLSPLVLALAKILPATSRTAGDAFWLEQTRTVHTATAAAYGVVTVSDPADPRLRLLGGRLLQRLHLAATVAGLGLQHMNQVTERIDRDVQLGQPARFGPRMDGLLAATDQHALSTFRLGHPVRSARLSPRRPVGEVTR